MSCNSLSVRRDCRLVEPTRPVCNFNSASPHLPLIRCEQISIQICCSVDNILLILSFLVAVHHHFDRFGIGSPNISLS